MRNRILFLLLIGFISLFQHRVTAQSNQAYLYHIGIPDSLYSNILGEERSIWVQLPEGFNPERKTQYPVVYVLDGGIQMDALTTVFNYYRGHHLPEMILVGIANRNNRTRDLTPSKVSHRNGGAMNEETGGAENFYQFIEKELIPYVDRKYPTTAYRTLIGHSYAGLFTINTLMNHPESFENYIAIDPSLDWDNQKLLKQIKADFKQENLKGKSLFVALGGGQPHMLDGTVTLDNVMQDTSEYSLFTRSIIEFSKLAAQQEDLNFSWKSYSIDYHWTLPLPAMIDGLVTQFEWYQLESATTFSNPDTPLEELLKLVKHREIKLKAHFGYAFPPFVEELFNQTGYMYLQFEQPEKSYAFFKMGVDYYPESANAYDSLADYYESQKDYANALKCVRKAFELDNDDRYKERMEALKGKQ